MIAMGFCDYGTDMYTHNLIALKKKVFFFENVNETAWSRGFRHMNTD